MIDTCRLGLPLTTSDLWHLRKRIRRVEHTRHTATYENGGLVGVRIVTTDWVPGDARHKAACLYVSFTPALILRGDNTQTTGPAEFFAAVEILENYLGLSLQSARIYRLDLAISIETDLALQVYIDGALSFPGRPQRPYRSELGLKVPGVEFEDERSGRGPLESKLFDAVSTKFMLYDKTAKNKRQGRPNTDENLLRIESQNAKKVARRLRYDFIEVASLRKKEVWQSFVRLFMKDFRNVQWCRPIPPLPNDSKGMKNFLIGKALLEGRKTGDPTASFEFIVNHLGKGKSASALSKLKEQWRPFFFLTTTEIDIAAEVAIKVEAHIVAFEAELDYYFTNNIGA